MNASGFPGTTMSWRPAIRLSGAMGWLAAAVASATPAAETVRPGADGTLADGAPYGTYDGVADDWDWTFNESSYEGAITLTCEREESCLETRVVWEYDLSRITSVPPVQAGLTFTIRGPSIFPFPDSIVHVYAYPADGRESSQDYASGPTVFQGWVGVGPYEDPVEFTLNVSRVVNEALTTGNRRVAMRFQIDPATAEDRQQAFIDALDSDPATKPYLTIDEAMPGDADRDGDVDLADYAVFHGCFGGPRMHTLERECLAMDFDADNDVDLQDAAAFQAAFGGS